MADQKQRVGRDSTNIQVGGDLVVGGVSVGEARQIAIDVMRAELNTLTAEARDTFEKRILEFADKMVAKISNASPKSLSTFREPATQLAIHSAQKQYGKTGDPDLRELLLSLLSDLFRQEDRNIMKIVLEESLEVAGKLTQDQINALSVIFVLRYTRNMGLLDHEMFTNYFRETWIPFVDNLPSSQARFQHLEFAGCGSISFGSMALIHIFKRNYPAIFSAGFPADALDQLEAPKEVLATWVIPCHNNSELRQLVFPSKDSLEKSLAKFNWPGQTPTTIRNFLDITLPDEEIIELAVRLCPEFQRIVDFWENTPANKMTLTSVGIAIGHANLKRQTGQEFDLDIWIN